MIFTIIAAVIALANIVWAGSFTAATASALAWVGVLNGLLAFALALAGFRKYPFQRLKPNPSIGKPPIWTLGRAFTYVVLIGALGAILMPLAHIIGW